MTSIAMTSLDGPSGMVASEDVEAFRQKLRGPLLEPDSAGYEEVTHIWNGIHHKRPGLIVLCSGAADVIDVLNFARERGLLVSIRGGGHEVSGLTLGDGGLTIDLSRLRGVRVNPIARTADVDPGATLGDLDRETQAFGLVAPAGVVSTTGVAGLTLGGGVGRVRRKFGLSIDNLLSAYVVTANEQFLTISEHEHADLFWAIRGGGGNFGIITSFRFRLHPLGPIVYFAAPIYRMERAPELLLRWRAAGCISTMVRSTRKKRLRRHMACLCPPCRGQGPLRPNESFPGESKHKAIGLMPLARSLAAANDWERINEETTSIPVRCHEYRRLHPRCMEGIGAQS